MLLSLLLLFSSPTLAAQTGQVQISGIIPQAVSIVVTPIAGTPLDLTQPAINIPVATVREVSNAPGGYTVTLTSQTGGKLGGSLTYTARYDGLTVTLQTTPQTVATQGVQSSPVNILKTLDVSHPAGNSLLAGTYQDTLTFTISAN